jgi:hypothetical protein
MSVSQFNRFLRQNVDFINFMYLKDYFVQILQLGQNGQQTVKMSFAGSSSSNKYLLLHHNLNKDCCVWKCYTMWSGTSIPTLQTYLLPPLSWPMYPPLIYSDNGGSRHQWNDRRKQPSLSVSAVRTSNLTNFFMITSSNITNPQWELGDISLPWYKAAI